MRNTVSKKQKSHPVTASVNEGLTKKAQKSNPLLLCHQMGDFRVTGPHWFYPWLDKYSLQHCNLPARKEIVRNSTFIIYVKNRLLKVDTEINWYKFSKVYKPGMPDKTCSSPTDLQHIAERTYFCSGMSGSA